MKVIRTIAFICATSILLLHTFIPHDHHAESTTTIVGHNQPADLIDQIALGFHLSQSDGDLENFSLDDSTIELNQQELLAVISVTIFGIRTADLQIAQSISTEQNTSFKSLNVAGFSHRGPPIS